MDRGSSTDSPGGLSESSPDERLTTPKFVMNNLVVKYFPVRGRCEPVLLKLADANISFDEDIISLHEWLDMKKSGKIGPPDFPSSSLPVLSFTDRNGERINLAETNAILFFLDRVYPVTKCDTDDDQKCILLARQDAILEMSMFYLNRVFQMTMTEDWIAGESRSMLGKGISARFLQGLEYHLQTTPSVIPGGDEALSGPISAAFVGISFTLDIFPVAKGIFPRCSALFDAVSQRERIREYYVRQGGARLEMPWTITEYGKAEYIRKVSASYAETDGALFV